jgi:antirestriction protein
MSDTPRIYVACLAAYNNGKLYGEWIDCDQDADDIQAAIDAILKASPETDAEEWAIHAYESFEGLSIGENESIEKVAELAALIIEHGAAYAAYIDHVGSEYATVEGFQDKYCGEHKSEENFAEKTFSETHEIPEFLASYIDWKRVATDLFIDDYFGSDRDGRIYVFRRS